jgi:hypothetical protein
MIKIIREFKLKWKWRKVPKSKYPLRYIGPTIEKFGLEYGMPIAITGGPKAGPFMLRYGCPDNMERHIDPKRTELR